jgi:hypothetical protein
MDGRPGGWTTELCAVHTLAIDALSAAALAVGNNGSIRTAGSSNDGLLCKLLSNFAGIVLVDACGKKKVSSAFNVGNLVTVLPRVGSLVFEGLDELVESGSKCGTKDRPKPVDPVVGTESAVDDCRAERTRWIEGTAGEVYTGQLSNEQRKANT